MDENNVPQVQFKETFDEFLLCLEEHEVATLSKFIVTDSCKQFTLDKDQLDVNKKIRWDENCTPYIHFGSRTYSCHQGKDKNIYQKKKYAEERDRKASMDHNFTKRYNLTQVTKKLDCPATIHVTRIMRFSAFKISGRVTDYEKTKQSKKIKDKLQNDDCGEMGYVFKLPPPQSHQNHLIGPESSSVEPIDLRVRDQIKKLVCRGERSASVIKKMLTGFVENHLQEYDQSRRRFYPDLALIRNIVYRAKSSLKNSPIDQENVEFFLKKIDQTKHSLFFRPHAMNSESEDEDFFIDDDKLLFVYQSADMRSLYRKYGANCILLDATYRTCKYAVPLFFIVVETNINFQVVGVIITQFETKDAITEGLTIFKSWNPDIEPQYGMVDFASEEINSLEQVFPSMKVFICSFHREQAWHRWLSRSGHSAIPKKEALGYLRKVANAPSEEELNKAIEDLRKWECFQTTDLKMYFEGTWYREIHRWALAFKPEDMYQNTNNGVERLNKELKYGYLEGLKGCSLSELVEVVIEKFLPERYKLYVCENVKMSPLVRKYGNDLPTYLHGRPKWLIDHVMSKLTFSSDKSVEVTQDTSEDKVFQVPSVSKKCHNYSVCIDEQLGKCSCTCNDYRKHRLICKHIILVGSQLPAFHLSATHTWVFKNPIFWIDEDVLPSNKENLNPNTDPVPVADTPSFPSTYSNQNLISPAYNELPLRGSNRRNLINDCNASIRSIQSVLFYLNESNLQDASTALKTFFKDISSKVEKDTSTGLPIESPASAAREARCPEKAATDSNQVKAFKDLKRHPKKGLTGRIGSFVDMMKESHNMNPIGNSDGTEPKRRKLT